MFGQKQKPIRSVASDGLTWYTSNGLTNIYKISKNQFNRKIGFKIETEIEHQSQSSPKIIGILNSEKINFGPKFGNANSDRRWMQAQNGAKFDF